MTETVESKKEKASEKPANGGASDDLKETERGQGGFGSTGTK